MAVAIFEPQDWRLTKIPQFLKVATHDSMFWGLPITYNYLLILLVASSLIHFLIGTSLIHLGLRRHHNAKLG